MQIILMKDVNGIGKAGEIKNVSDGYARNFLFPQKCALAANDANKRVFDNEKARERKAAEKEIHDAKLSAEKLEKVSCTLKVKVGEEDKMYGSVTTHDIAKKLEEQGFTAIDKKMILLDEPLKELGVYTVDVKLQHDIIAKVKIWVVKE